MTNVNSDRIEQGFVLGNKVLVAEVFAKHGFLVLSSVTEQEKTSELKRRGVTRARDCSDTSISFWLR